VFGIEGRRHLLQRNMTEKRIDFDSDLSNMLNINFKQKDPLMTDGSVVSE